MCDRPQPAWNCPTCCTFQVLTTLLRLATYQIRSVCSKRPSDCADQQFQRSADVQPEYLTLLSPDVPPGIDGTGLAAYKQFPALTEAFDFVALSVPAHDRTRFPRLVEIVE